MMTNFGTITHLTQTFDGNWISQKMAVSRDGKYYGMLNIKAFQSLGNFKGEWKFWFLDPGSHKEGKYWMDYETRKPDFTFSDIGTLLFEGIMELPDRLRTHCLLFLEAEERDRKE